ncbi:MAG TPA: glycosyltransferase family 9 protein [Kineosporiaceae bacterium]
MAEPSGHGAGFRDILLVELLGGIGDLLMFLPVVHALARRHRQARIRVLTHDPGAELLRDDPAVSDVRAPARRGAEREAVAAALAEHAPDLAVTTTRFAGIPDLLAGGATRAVTDLWRRPPGDELVTARYLRILHAEGLIGADELPARPRLPLAAERAGAGRRLLAGCLPPRPRGAPVLLVPDAGMAVKRWPDRSWTQLAAALTRRGHPVLATAAPGPVPTLPRVDLPQLAGILAAVAAAGGVVVGGDTGPVRLAAAVGAPTVALFGPTLASRYGLGAGRQLQGLAGCPHRRGTSITEQVCWWDAACPLRPAGPACMADITVEEVTAAVLGAVAEPGDGRTIP